MCVQVVSIVVFNTIFNNISDSCKFKYRTIMTTTTPNILWVNINGIRKDMPLFAQPVMKKPTPLLGKVICERQRALYGIKCVLRIIWQTWLYILTNKNICDALQTPVPCSTLTHSTNEDLLNIKRKGDPEVSYPLSYVRYHWNPEPVCNRSHFVSLSLHDKYVIVPADKASNNIVFVCKSY